MNPTHSDDNNAASTLKADVSPGPFIYEKLDTPMGGYSGFIYGNGNNQGWAIAHVCTEPNGYSGDANGAHIVRCVNDHDDLVGALGRTLQQLTSIRNNLKEHTVGRAETDQVIFHCSRILEKAKQP